MVGLSFVPCHQLKFSSLVGDSGEYRSPGTLPGVVWQSLTFPA